MKKILLALLICAGVASCKDDDPGTEPPKPKVSLTEGTSTTTSITFTVTPDEAEKCAYLYSKVEENAQVEQPSAETVLKDGVQISAEQATPVTLSPLDPESTYIVFAAASNGSVLSEVTTLRMETGLLPEPDYETWVQATSGMGQYNTISWAAEPTGNYMVQFSDIEFDEYGEAQSAGYKIVLDLYGSLTDDVMNPTIPQGTYQFDAEDSYTHFTFQKSYSNIYQTDDQGYPIGYGLYITGGSLTVKTNEDGYSVVGYLTDEEGHTYKVSYEGPMVIANKTGGTGSNQTIENPSLLLARYYGDLDHANTGNYYLSVGTVTVDPDDPFTTTSSGWQVILDFWDQKSADDDNAILPEGTYDLADTHAARTINYEETRIMHYYLTGKTPEMAEFDYSDASVQVEHVAGGYKLTGHFVLEDGNSVDFVYEGPIDFENLAEPLIGNVNETFTIAKGEYLGDYNSVGNDNYTLHLYTDEAQSTFINIDLNAQTATNLRYPVIPDGNYDAGVPDSYETGTFTPGHLLYGSYLSGTTVGRKVNGEVSAYSFITAGTISFTYNEADETYDIRVNATTSDNFTVEGTFHGKIELENTLLGPEVGNISFQANYVPNAYYYGLQNGSYRYYLTFSDIEMEGTMSGIYPANTEAGHCILFDIYTDTPGDVSDLRLPVGTFTMSDSKQAGTWNTGAEGRIYDASGNRTNVSFVEGTIVIEQQGDGYQLTLDAETLREETFHCTYSGSFPITDYTMYGAPMPLESFANGKAAMQGNGSQKEHSVRIAPAPSKDARLKLPASSPRHPLSNDFPVRAK